MNADLGGDEDVMTHDMKTGEYEDVWWNVMANDTIPLKHWSK